MKPISKVAIAAVCLLVLGGGVLLPAHAQSYQYPRNLTVGDVGSDVSTLQQFLITGGFLHIVSPTGYFGNLTQAAVAEWQASVGLPNTGFFGPLSRAQIEKEGGGGSGGTITFPRNLTVGDTGFDVTTLQQYLITNNFLHIVSPTGYFGDLTQAAVMAWQGTVGLPTTGFFGPLSRAELTTILNQNTGGGGNGGGGNGGGGGGGGNGGGGGGGDTQPPSVPTGLIQNVVGSTTVSFSWNSSTDNVGVVGYYVFRNGAEISATPSTNYIDTGLAPNTSYSYTVAAYDASGNISAQSSGLLITTLSSGGGGGNGNGGNPPNSPTGLQTESVSQNGVLVSWQPAADAYGTVAGYYLYRGGTQIANVSSTSYIDNSLSAASSYTYTVAAYDTQSNASQQSGGVQGTTLGDTIPASQFSAVINRSEDNENPANVILPMGTGRIWDDNAQWQDWEPTQNTWDWTSIDTVLQNDKSIGANTILFTVMRVPDWATTSTDQYSNGQPIQCNYYADGDTRNCYPMKDINPDGTGSDSIWRTMIAAVATHIQNLNPAVYAHVKYWGFWDEIYRSTTLAPGFNWTGQMGWEGTNAQMLRAFQDASCIITGRTTEITATGETCQQVLQSVGLTAPVDPTEMIGAPAGSGGNFLGAYGYGTTANFLYCNNNGTNGFGQCNTYDAQTNSTEPMGSLGAQVSDYLNYEQYYTHDTDSLETDISTLTGQIKASLQPAELQKFQISSEGGYNIPSGKFLNDDEQRSYMGRYFLLMASNHISPTVWYSYDESPGGSGLYDPLSGQLTPGGQSWQVVNSWMVGSQLTQPCSNTSGNIWTCGLTLQNGTQAEAVWDATATYCKSSTSTGCAVTATMAVPSGFNEYEDLFSTSTHAIQGNTLSLTLSPILIEKGNAQSGPATPTGLASTTVSQSQIGLTWTDSDNTVTGYDVYRNGVEIASPATNSYLDTGLQPSMTYTYTVDAFNAQGIRSSLSSPLSVTTGPPPTNALIAPAFFSVNNVNPTDTPEISYGLLNHPSSLVWENAEPSRGVFLWTRFDQFVTTQAPKNPQGVAQIVLTLGETPGWAVANQSTCTTKYGVTGCTAPPDNIQDWTNFITALVQHYNGTTEPHVQYYEIWNEAQAGGNFWTGTMAQLEALAQAAYPIIHTDPYSQVVTPSFTGPTASSSLYGFLQAGGGQYADAASYHGYIHANPIETTVPLYPDTFRQVMDQNGMIGKPILSTEGGFGLVGDSGYVSDPHGQAAYVARYYLIQAGRVMADNITTVAWFTWGDTPNTGGDGIIENNDGTPNIAGVAYDQVYNWLVGASINPCTSQGTVWTCTITRSGGYQAYATWDTSQTCNGTCTTQNQSVPSGYTYYRDLAGDPAASISGGTVPVGLQPILVENQNR